jgi:hypothetical protein
MAGRWQLSFATVLASLVMTGVAIHCSAIEENKPSNFNVEIFGSSAPTVIAVVTATACQPVTADAGGGCKSWSEVSGMLEKLGCNGVGSCHGGSAKPPLKGAQPGWYDSLKDHKYSKRDFPPGVPFINTCSNKPEDHPMYCNLGSCSPNKDGYPMPPPPGMHPVAAADDAILKAWVSCGSPR